MPLPDANKKSPRVYTNLQNIDLENITFANIEATGNPIAIEELNEDELRRLVLCNLARLVVKGEWTGLLESGGGAETLGDLTDVLLDTAEFDDGILIQPDSGGSAPTTGTLDGAVDNVGIGANTFSTLTTGYANIALGAHSMESAITTNRCVAIGREALASEESAQGGEAIGYWALKQQNGTGRNTAIGSLSGYSVTTGSYNTLIGYYSGFNINEGADNLCIGDYAGKSLTTGDGCVFIGTETEADSATDDLQLKIAGAHSFGATSMTWISSDSTGSCYQGDNASSWSTTSDKRLKREIADATKGLDAINAIQVRTFRYRKDNPYNIDPELARVGVIAQELEHVFPESVKENGRGHKTVSTDSINWALLKAVQELSAKVAALEAAA